MAKEGRLNHISICEQSAERWVLRRLGKIGHERRVTTIATKLFEVMQNLHGLDASQRRLLRLGAMLHDVGRSVEDRRHPAIGAAMIMEDQSLPVSLQDRRRLAYLTRYHRGAVPEVGYDGILRAGDSRKAMRRILALLRAADSFDNRNIAPPRIVFFMKARRLRVTCYIEQDCAKARRALGKPKKLRLLEDLFGCKLEVRIKLAEAIEAT